MDSDGKQKRDRQKGKWVQIRGKTEPPKLREISQKQKKKTWNKTLGIHVAGDFFVTS